MSISRLIEKLALVQLESGDRELVLSSGTGEFEIVAVAPPFLLGDEATGPVLLELQPLERRGAPRETESTTAVVAEEPALQVA